MADAVVMPALEMAQETGVLVRWLKQEGEQVAKGEPLMEVETDKATVEIESPAAGVLGGVVAREGDVVPVGQTIAWVLAPGEKPPAAGAGASTTEGAGRARSFPSGSNGRPSSPVPDAPVQAAASEGSPAAAPAHTTGSVAVTPLARNIAEEKGVDLSRVPARGNRIEKEDVLAYLSGQHNNGPSSGSDGAGRLRPASPKARRIARELGVELTSVAGSGPGGAVLAADVEASRGMSARSRSPETTIESPGATWLTMARRMSASWTEVPHFYLMREVEADRLLEWRDRSAAEIEEQAGTKLTVSDLLVTCVARALSRHRRLNAAWNDGTIRMNGEINVGLAVALESGLVVPVIRNADSASLAEIASRRAGLVSKARERRLAPAEMADGTFTITNLGMYNVDAFNAIVNPPQAAILAVGRIADRVIAVDGRPEVRAVMTVTLSCDHRVVDGAQAARFLDDLVRTLQDPWRLLV